MKLFFKIVGGLLLLIFLAAGGFAALNWSMVTQIVRFSPLILPPMYGEPADEAEAHQQDIKFLRRFIKYDRSYSDQERTAFNTHLDEMERNASTLSDAELYLGTAYAAAISDNAHTGVSSSPLFRKFNRIDVKFFWFADGLHVVRAHQSMGDLVGARVVAIEGRDVTDVQLALSKYTGGVPQWRKLYSPLFMESPEVMHAAGLAASPNELSLKIVNSEGVERDLLLAGKTAPGQEDLPFRRPWMAQLPIALPDEGDDWKRVLTYSGEAPLYLRDTDNNFFWTEIDGGVYLRPQLLLERKETPILANFEAVLAAADDNLFDTMIVDLRWSPGGDYTKVIDFVKAAPQAIKDDGRLYIVVGPQTFSAALVTVAFLKYYGGEKSVIVGSPMGDGERFWAERGFPFTLPNSGYGINYATGYHDWENGCAGKHEYCFDQNLIHEVPAGSLLPSVVIEPTYADYASGRDIVMDWIMADQQSRNAPPVP